MAMLHNLKPERVMRAFEKAGWVNKGQRGSHVKLEGLTAAPHRRHLVIPINEKID